MGSAEREAERLDAEIQKLDLELAVDDRPLLPGSGPTPGGCGRSLRRSAPSRARSNQQTRVVSRPPSKPWRAEGPRGALRSPGMAAVEFLTKPFGVNVLLTVPSERR